MPNVAGIIGMESSPFGEMYGEVLRSAQNIEEPWGIGFECLRIRSWRDTARYAGYEAIQEEGLKALERLPMLMEEIHESWAKSTKTAQFKAENMIHFDSPEALTEAAKAVAKRLKLDEAGTKAMVDRYLGYRRELSGPGTKPMPPVFSIIAKNSRDHTPEGYKDFYLPFYSRMKPAPKVLVVQVDAGTHGYSAAEEGLPMGIAPVGAHLWYKAITGGFYAKPRRGARRRQEAAPQEKADDAAIKIGGTARERFPAFQLIGNVHYVGSSNAGAFLLTTPEGHILIDSGYPKTEAWIRESIESLGFKLSDVRIMLNTHAHADHVGGHARLKEWTGARVLTSAADKPVLADGGRSDFRSDGSLLWLPVAADGTISDGQKISLGGTTLVAHLTPGHTRGNTTWTTTVTEAGKTYQVVFAGSMGLNANVPLDGQHEVPGDRRRLPAVLREAEVAPVRRLPAVPRAALRPAGEEGEAGRRRHAESVRRSGRLPRVLREEREGVSRADGRRAPDEIAVRGAIAFTLTSALVTACGERCAGAAGPVGRAPWRTQRPPPRDRVRSQDRRASRR